MQHNPDHKAIYNAFLREELLKPGLDFNKFFFKHREGFPFDQQPHHIALQRVLDDVLEGKRTRVIINIAPGWSKTMLAVIDFVAKGFAIEPRSRFLHASYNEQLATTNSLAIKDTMQNEFYQSLWPMKIRNDAKSKLQWVTENGGVWRCGAAGGGWTGHRAGRNIFDNKGKPEFAGALIMDDPLKVDDARSVVERTKVNVRYMGTFRSRLQHHQVPVIIIAQRLHEDDLPAFLLRGGSGEMWDHLVLPAIWPEEERPYNKQFTHGNPIDVNNYLPDAHGYVPGESTWKNKEPTEKLLQIKAADRYTYDAQYAQTPSPLGGSIFKSASWKWYVSDPANLGAFEGIGLRPSNVTHRAIFADTAMKTGEQHDYSVFQSWSKVQGVGIFLEDQARGKWDASDLRRTAYQFYQKHKKPTVQNNYSMVRYMGIEDRSSGVGLIQDLDRQMGVPVKPLPKNRDKVSSYMDVVTYIDSGQVWLPIDASWVTDFTSELEEITPFLTHRHDDQADTMYLAIRDMLSEQAGGLYQVA